MYEELKKKKQKESIQNENTCLFVKHETPIQQHNLVGTCHNPLSQTVQESTQII